MVRRRLVPSRKRGGQQGAHPAGLQTTVPNAKIPSVALRSQVPALLTATDAWIGHYSKKPVVLPRGTRAARTNDPKSWRSFEDALKFYERTITDPRAGVGFVFQRAQGVVFIDFDHCLDEEGAPYLWAATLLAPFFGRTFIECSLSGRGLHVMVLGSLERAHSNLVPPGAENGAHVELYNDLRFVAVTGNVLEGNPITLAPMQGEIDALLTMLGADARTAATPAPPHDALTPEQLAERTEEARSALAAIDPDVDYGEWIQIGMAMRHGLGDRGLEIWDAWSARGRKYKKGEPAERWASFRKSGITLNTLFFMAKGAGWRSPLDDPERQFGAVEPEGTPSDIPFSEGTFQEWVRDGYQMWKPNPKQEILIPVFHEGNLIRFFTHHEDWAGRLRYNLRSMYPEIDGEVVDDLASYRALSQSHAYLGWTKRTLGLTRVQAAIQTAAEHNAYDPVAEWIRSLKWDGTARAGALTETLGVEDTPLTRRCLLRWLIGAVARALQPGCKMQNMLLLLGPQGRRKSKLLEQLAVRPEWFHESHTDLSNKEGYLTLDRKWIVEFAELDSLRKVDVERVKAFISESVSNYREPYARATRDHPRRFVLGGTANEDKVLRDPTGARRFWPIRCPGKLNIEALTPEFVAQLWAEVAKMYADGVRWWDDDAEVDEVGAHNEQFYAEVQLDVAVAKILEEEFAPHGALRMPQLITRLHELRLTTPTTSMNAIGAILRRNQWVLRALRIEDEVLRFWFPPTVPDKDQKQAAVLVLANYRRSIGQFEPMALEEGDKKRT